MQGALRKEPRIAPFVERFKIAILGRFCWWILPVLGISYLNFAFLSIFCWWKVMYSVLFERSCTFFLSWSALRNYFGKVLLINFAGRSTEGTAYWSYRRTTLKQLFWESCIDNVLSILRIKCLNISFFSNFTDTRLSARCFAKGPSNCFFRREL